MEQRAAIPPDLPRLNPTVSFWQNPPSPLAHHRSTPHLPTSSDVLIIGSGITGACIAFNVLDHPSPPSVLMLEARTACSGATGRNGGHTKHASYREFIGNVNTEGEAEASKIARFEYECMKAVHAFARDHGIQCDSWEGDTVDVMYHEGQLAKAKNAVGEMKRILGADDPVADYKFWCAEQTKKTFLAEGSLGAISYAAGSLNAYKFGIGVLDLAIKKGLNLQTETPASKITKRDDGQIGWNVETLRGRLQAQKVILATNGYTVHLCPALQGVIVPLRGHMTAQRPGSLLPRTGLSTTYSFIYDDGYEYMIPRLHGSVFSGDIMIGGGATKAPHAGLNEFGTTDDTITDPVITKYLKDSTTIYFGSNWGDDHPDGRLRQAWTGIMGYSADGFPLIGQLPNERGLYIAASFQGSGMVLSLLSAKVLVKMMHNDDNNELDRWLPRAFRMGPDRLKRKFRGRLHTVAPMDLEVKSQA
ncbi:MAG: hypothetical protein Q9217_006550 [Psora testacea]